MNAEEMRRAAQAAFPELWPAEGYDENSFMPLDWDNQQRAEAKAILASKRSDAIQRVARAFNTVPPGQVSMPEDAVMIEQTLMAFTYLDKHGRVMYGMRTIGDTSIVTWLGLAELAKHYVLAMNAQPWEERDSE